MEKILNILCNKFSMKYKESPKFMVLKGLLQIIVAYILYRYGDMYGYQIKKKLEEINQKKLPQGLIYVTLKRMVNNGILETYDKEDKKYYRLTEGGRTFLINHIDVLRRVDNIIHDIIQFMAQ